MNFMEMKDRCTIWFAVLNVYAASKQAVKRWAKAEKRLKDRGVVYHGNRTGRSGNAMEITFDACMAGYRKFIAVGGDGTIHDVLNGIAAFVDWTIENGGGIGLSDFTLAAIPVGSGNDWIKSVAVPKDVADAVDVLVDGTLRRQDVVRVSLLDYNQRELSRSYMANIGGIGIDARVCEKVNALKKRGKRGRILYVTSLIEAIRERKPGMARVVCDGETVFDGEYFSMAFGVGKYSGGGMRQTPEAVLDDGLLDMTIIPELPLRRIAREAPRLFTDSFLKVPELVVSKCKCVTVCPYGSADLEPVEVDGEVVGRGDVRFQVLDGQINIMTGLHQ